MKQIVQPMGRIDDSLAALRDGAGPGLAPSQHMAPVKATTIIFRGEGGTCSRFIMPPIWSKT